MSPFDLISGPKAAKHLPNVLSPEEVELLMNFKPSNNLEIRDLAIIELMYSSGLRVSEAAGIDIKDFEENMEFLRVFGKGSKTRLVPIGRFAKEAISKWLLEREKIKVESDAVFINLKGADVRAFAEAISKVTNKKLLPYVYFLKGEIYYTQKKYSYSNLPSRYQCFCNPFCFPSL